MTLITDRMILRKLSEEDAQDLYALDQDIEVRRYIDGCKPPAPWPAWRKKASLWIESVSRLGLDLGFWTARFPDNSFIGFFHLRPNKNVFPGEMELGYRLHSKFWRQGLATEGARKLLDLAFSELGIGYVMATTLEANLASRRVMEKCGMQFRQRFLYPKNLVPYLTDSERAAVKYAIIGPA